jgi:hypothetical protein
VVEERSGEIRKAGKHEGRKVGEVTGPRRGTSSWIHGLTIVLWAVNGINRADGMSRDCRLLHN